MQFLKGVSVPIGTHFSSVDFDCACQRVGCTTTLIDDNLPNALDLFWAIVGPFKINSGFRCAAHNKEIGGAAYSQHTLGKAADCKSLTGKTGAEMAKCAESVTYFEAGGIGQYSTFVHVDIRKVKARWKSGIKPSQIVVC